MPTRRTFVLGALSVGVATACGKAARRAGAPAAGHAGGPSTAAVGTTTTIVPPPGGPASYIANGPRSATTVALTFHGSGDSGLTDQILTLAARLQAPITVFAVGQWLEQNPTMADKILGGGHELANHTYTHPSLGQLGRDGVAQEIVKCRDVLVAQSHSTGSYFRPSGIETRPAELILEEAGKAGYTTCVGFDVDPLDYNDPGSVAIVSRVATGLRPGSIVSLHLGHTGTVAAFERIVSTVRNRGLKPALVSDVLP